MTGSLALVLAATATAAALVTPPAGRPADPPPPAITGTVTSEHAGAPLPADAIVRVWLESESSFHQPARRVAETSFSVAGRRFPIPFTLTYPAADVDPTVHYQLRALVSAGKKVLFFARLGQPVALGGTPAKVAVAVEPFGGRKLQVTAISPNVGLSGEWGLSALPGERTPIEPLKQPPTLAIDGPGRKISGSTGCNRFFGTLTIGSANALTLDPSGMTRMACPDAVTALENAFLQALRATGSYRIRGATLELLAGDRVLARFERRRAATPSD